MDQGETMRTLTTPNGQSYLSMSPQERKVINHLEQVGHLSFRDALIDLDIADVRPRIFELRHTYGFNIKSDEKRNPHTGARYVRYRLVTPEERKAA
jgi:hypothetical protein